MKDWVIKWFLPLIALWLAVMSLFRPLSLPDEGRYAGIARWMVVSHDWLIPRINGIAFLQKPPLMYWIDAAAMSVFGVNEWTARFAPWLAANAMLWAGYWFAKKHLGADFARFSVVLLASNVLFFGASQYANTDLLVAAGVTLAILGFADAVLSGSKKGLWLGYTACALAVMSKGLIGVLLPGLVLLPWLAVMRQVKQVKFLLHPLGVAWFLGLTVPWVWMVQAKYPNFLHFFLIEQQFSRFSKASFNNLQPWYFYGVVLLLSVLPLLLVVRWRGVRERILQRLGQPIGVLSLWWLCAMTVFFSLPASKLVGYILVVMLPLVWLVQAALPATADRRIGRDILPLLDMGLLGLVSIGVGFLPHKAIAHVNHHQLTVISCCGVVLLAAAAVLWFMWSRRHAMSLSATLGVAGLVVCTVLTVVFGQINDKSNKDSLAQMPSIDDTAQVVFVGKYYFDVPFYLNLKRPVAVVDDWDHLRFDSWQDQLHDGARFEPSIDGQLLWSMAQLQTRVEQHTPMVIFADKSVRLPLTAEQAMVEEYRNYRVYRVH